MKYQKKPVVIEAFKWTGGPDRTEDPVWIVERIKDGSVYFADHFAGIRMYIEALEGTLTADSGDYIIKDENSEIYPCKPDIFEQTYEPVTESKHE